MDALTHMMIGGIAAQIPAIRPAVTTPTSALELQQDVNWQTRCVIGALAAIFPDIDYLLFWLNPLDFLAYWHRAETHSVLLAPLWSLLLTYAIVKSTALSNKRLLFTIILLGILSHIVSDSLTVFGTRWFAPFSELQISWNLLFVFEPYFTFSLLITAFFLYVWRDKRYRYLALTFPCLYLSFVTGVKLQLSQLVEDHYQHHHRSAQQFELLPQPFSPLYWQVLSKNDNTIEQSYIKLIDDIVASTITNSLGLTNYSQSFHPVSHLQRTQVSNLQGLKNSELATAWNQPKFKSFRDFSDYPVFLEQTNTNSETCFWFSDLRYHWPQITPTFRYAICRNESENWQVKRLKYFSDVSHDL